MARQRITKGVYPSNALIKTIFKKHNRNVLKRERARVTKSERTLGPAIRPPTRDKEAVQARKWLDNEMRKPGVRLSEIAVAHFNAWTRQPEKWLVRMVMNMSGKQVMDPAAAAARARFVQERAVAKRAQGVEKGAGDWWKVEPGKTKRGIMRMLEEAGTMNPEDWRKRKEKEEDSGDGDVELPVEMEGMEEDDIEEQEGGYESSDMGLEPVTRAVSEEVDDGIF